MKILLAEDEEDLKDVLKEMLLASGYAVDAVNNGKEALDRAKSDAYDAMVFDVMMPVMDGITALKEIRKGGDHTPALFLTAKTEVDDRIVGLDAGADDYLTKPFALRELLARIRAMTRRYIDYSPQTIRLGDVSLDVAKAELSARNTITLAVRECRMLEQFMTNPGKDFTAAELLERFWGPEEADEEAVWMYISFLKNKLKAIGGSLRLEGERGGVYCLKE